MRSRTYLLQNQNYRGHDVFTKFRYRCTGIRFRDFLIYIQRSVSRSPNTRFLRYTSALYIEFPYGYDEREVLTLRRESNHRVSLSHPHNDGAHRAKDQGAEESKEDRLSFKTLRFHTGLCKTATNKSHYSEDGI